MFNSILMKTIYGYSDTSQTARSVEVPTGEEEGSAYLHARIEALTRELDKYRSIKEVEILDSQGRLVFSIDKPKIVFKNEDDGSINVKIFQT